MLLAEVPKLGGLYAKAALASVTRRGGAGKNGPLTLPGERHEARGVRIQSTAVDAYDRLFHAPSGDLVPSAYVHSVAFPVAMSVMTRDDFPLPLLGMVHLSNHVEQTAPISRTDTLDISAWVENLRPHPRGAQLDVHTEASVNGRVVWRERAVYLAKGKFSLPASAGSPERGMTEQGLTERSTTARQDFVPPVPTALWSLGAGVGREYAGVSGDVNPIHLSSVSAKALGMKRTVAHGMYSVARVLAEAGRIQGVRADLGPCAWDVYFEAPILLPGKVSVAITDGPGDSREFTAWNAKNGRRHFYGDVRPVS
ncbi:MaoC/PaaZ C-terminal domain-containing protein [Haematomicrobium sanguinis]|uniref:MaoC/PaaZ C-terminal domain-containing protein n=1 Tax=Haematomicrobium sanguinis TaxID=479106 RepID=UPI000552C002|nr:MaoC/PaaZ C-terminal domain-containing protein [Haematomicrobium sanguinis]